MPAPELPEWERVLSAAAHPQSIVPDAVLVGGTAAAVYARRRLSTDADHVIVDLRDRFDQVLAQLEAVAGWKTARVKRPVLILGSLDGIETGIPQLIRDTPLETTEVDISEAKIRLPSKAEILRIKGVLILKRNATRDYLDFAALADSFLSSGGQQTLREALSSFDALYPQPNDESVLQQLLVQLGQPMPCDLERLDLSEYKQLHPKWQDWEAVAGVCLGCAILMLDGL